MNSPAIKTFDAVQVVRAIRDELSVKIAAMSVEDENRWLRSTEFTDPRLQSLMEQAAQQRAAADGADDRQRRG